MPKRTLIELLHIAAGVAGCALIAWAAAWAVPNAFATIWNVSFVSMAVVLGMGLKQLRAAWDADRATGD